MVVAIVGGGPAGLMAAEVVRAAGLDADVYEGQGSVGRKFLLAGKGGLNLTHSEMRAAFVARYRERAEQVGAWLEQFDNDAVRHWARDLGIETFIGTSGRVFPADLKAAPLLRSWVRRLRHGGVRFHVHHYCTGRDRNGSLHFETPTGQLTKLADATILALGGGSWPQLGSDGAWVPWLSLHGVSVAPLHPANCGFDVNWSSTFVQRFAGHPVKSVLVSAQDQSGQRQSVRGEFVITNYGVEGSAVYALSALLRDALQRDGSAELQLDLAPDRPLERLERELSRSPTTRTTTERLRRIGIADVKTGLLYEFVPRADMNDAARLTAAIKELVIPLQRPRPISEAISSAGGVRLEALDPALMIKSMPGCFCAGEMLDWEAPTGGYLLNACFASGCVAAAGAICWLNSRGRSI
jgi:uncharacterized flavoprotein (TIGR03862 family)